MWCIVIWNWIPGKYEECLKQKREGIKSQRGLMHCRLRCECLLNDALSVKMNVYLTTSLMQGGMDRPQPSEQRFWQDVDYPRTNPLCPHWLWSPGGFLSNSRILVTKLIFCRWTRLTRSQLAGVCSSSSQHFSSGWSESSLLSQAATSTRRRRSSWPLPGFQKLLSRWVPWKGTLDVTVNAGGNWAGLPRQCEEV